MYIMDDDSPRIFQLCNILYMGDELCTSWNVHPRRTRLDGIQSTNRKERLHALRELALTGGLDPQECLGAQQHHT